MNNYRDQDATPSEKAFHFFALLLFNKRAYSLSELSALLSMSKPAVSRMIRNFESAGIGVLQREQRGREVYIKLERTQTDPNISLNAEGLRQLFLCREFLAHVLPENLRDAILSTLSQAALFTPAPDRSLHPIPARSLYKGRIDYTPHQNVLASLVNAIEKKLVCRITYKSPLAREAKTWLFAPKRLLTYHEAIYIDGWQVTSDADPERVYADKMRLPLQRIRKCEPTEASSAKLPDTPVNDQLFGIMEEEEFELVARFCGAAADYVAERIWSKDQKIEPDGENAIILRLKAANAPETISWLLGFGDSVHIISPDWLIREFRSKLRDIARLYRKSHPANTEINISCHNDAGEGEE